MESKLMFRVVGVPRGAAAEFARRAVLEPLAGPAGDDAQVVARTMELVEIWRRRIPELGRAGLREFAGRSTGATRLRVRAANCPPGFIKQDPRAAGAASSSARSAG